jgi:multidrug efflux system membrane fusion protein
MRGGSLPTHSMAAVSGSDLTRRRRVRISGAAAAGFVLLAVLVGWHAVSSGKVTPPAMVPTVAVAAVQREDLPVVLQALGTVTPLSTVTVRSQISGYLVGVMAQEGHVVKRGDFLAQIDARPYQANLAQAQGQLIRDSALLKNAKLDLARYERLIAQDATSHQARDTAEATVSQYEGAVRSDRAQIETQRLNVEYCHIVSPTDGRVGLRQVDAGNFIQPMDASGLMVITQLRPISVIFILPQGQLGAVLKRLNTGARLQVSAFDGEDARMLGSGVLEAVDNQIDTATGTVKLRASFANLDDALFPNQFVNVHLIVDTVKGALTIPTVAIRRGASGAYVFVLGGDGLVHTRTIVTGPQYQGRTLVSSGLALADRVVTDGIDQVDDGMRVSVTGAEGSRP